MHILANDYEANIPGATKYGLGGPARFSSQLVESLVKAGHRYTGVVMKNQELKEPLFELAATKGRETYLTLAFPIRLYQSITKAKKPVKPSKALADAIEAFRELIRRAEPDIIFINGFDLRVWPLIMAAHLEKIPYVQKHAGIWHKEIAIYEDFFTAAGRNAMKSMERDIAKHATKQVFLNTFSEDVFQKDVAASPKSQRAIIPLPTPFVATKKKPKKKNKRLHIGVVARWDRIKNHAAILALAEELISEGVDAKIHVITNIPETPKDKKMKERYREIIQIHPSTDAKGILKFFRSMDIAILPSHFDVSPTVVLEAASQGIGTIISPTVGWVNHYRKTGNKEWIGDFNKPKTIIKKIKSLSGKPLSATLLKQLKRDHDPKRVFPQYIKLFKSLTN
jgi:glycosyltransferase involved in cell wall biosynthesis